MFTSGSLAFCHEIHLNTLKQKIESQTDLSPHLVTTPLEVGSPHRLAYVFEWQSGSLI